MRVRVRPPPEEEAGWTAEKSPKGLKVLETEHSSRNVLAQYLHNIFKLHFRWLWGKELKTQTKPMCTNVKVLL